MKLGGDWQSKRAALAVAVAVLLSASASLACGRDATSQPASWHLTAETASSRPRPVLLMFHSGAFVFGDTESLDEAAEIARRDGFRPVTVGYPLANLPKAVASSVAAARRLGSAGRPVYAYGESAGGTLAAVLAERGLVDAVATYSQVTDLPAFVRAAPDPQMFKDYIRATPRQIRRSSPARGSTSVPFLALTGEADLPGFEAATKRWAKANPSVTADTVPGLHVGDEEGTPVYSANVERSLSWLTRHVKRRSG